MNISLKLTIPLIDNSGNERELKLDGSLFLTPFYATEEDIISPFPDITEEDLTILRKIIFNSSLQVNRLTERVETLKILSTKQLFAMRRDYVICLATNELAKRLNTNLTKSINKSKSLGDFSVSTSVSNDTTVLNKIFSDSKQCIHAIESMIKQAEQDMILPVEFVKGRYNSNNIQANDRLWWLKDLDGGSRVIDGYASNKLWYNGNAYKTASLNRASISNGMSTLDYYRRGNEE